MIRYQNIDLNDASSFDYYGVTAAQGSQIATSGAALLGALSSLRKSPTSELDADVSAHCGKRPFFIGKRRNKFNKCKADLIDSIANNQKKSTDATAPDAANSANASNKEMIDNQVNAQIQAAKLELAQKEALLKAQLLASQNTKKQVVKPSTILGMSKPAFWIGLSVLVIGIGSLVTYKIVKSNHAKLLASNLKNG